MSRCVLDASAAIAMALQDEATVEDDALLDQIADMGATVTGLWHLEVANVLLMAERRKRLTPSERLATLSKLGALPIIVDTEISRQAWGRTTGLAEVHCLTIYDASYLELAIRLVLPLATRDKELLLAATSLELPTC